MADSRDTDIGTDAEPSENETGFAGHLLSTDNPWDEPDDELVRQLHYTEPQLRRFEHYRGPLEKIPEDEVRALLVEILSYLEVEGYNGFPWPPQGLPGLNQRPKFDDPAHRIIRMGFAYFVAAARGQGRAMHNRWNDAGNYARRLQDEARTELINEQVSRAFRKSDERRDQQQFVYFIGSETGPIKVGVAASPQVRLKALQTGHHETLTILATCDGDAELERKYHREFAAHRLAGEWFERCPEILAEIERLSG